VNRITATMFSSRLVIRGWPTAPPNAQVMRIYFLINLIRIVRFSEAD